MTYVRPFTVILRKLFLFLPYLRMDNNLKLMGEKANTKSTQAGKEL